MNKLLFENKWVSLYETPDGYVYSHETRCNSITVAILILDRTKKGQCLGRYEICPAHGDTKPELSSFTGGLMQGKTPVETAVEEIYEEAGYKADVEDLIYLGTARPSKSADTTTYLFMYDANGQIPETPKGDGSKGEVGSYTNWVNILELVGCQDPLMHILLNRAAYHDYS